VRFRARQGRMLMLIAPPRFFRSATEPRRRAQSVASRGVAS